MPASTGRIGVGVLLKLGDGASPEVFATLANVTELNAGGITVNMEDATHLASPNFYAELIPALKESEEWTFTLQWDPTSATLDSSTGVRSFIEGRTQVNLQVDPSAIGLDLGFQAAGWFSQMGNVSITPREIMTQQCSYRPTGQVAEFDFSA